MEGNKYIKERYNLHNTPEVRSAVRREEAISDEKVSQKPLEQIQVYFDRFKEITERENPEERERGIRALKEVLYRETVIAEDDVPESYFELQQKIARENGDTEAFSPARRAELIELVQEDQKESLSRWIDCLAGPDEYPDWAKYWAIRSVMAMGPYDVQKHEYSKRSKGTTKGFPELNEEALSYVVDVMSGKLAGAEVENPVKFVPNPQNPNEQKKFTDEQFAQLLNTDNFSKYYAFAIEHAVSDNRELFHITEGEWKTFAKGSEPDELCALLQGHGTGWCTAGKAMAKSQLTNGDFSVYCSKNALGEAVIPRVAIRMSGENIAEVRGVEPGQDMDPYITGVVREKMNEFGAQGESYKKSADNVDALASIETKTESKQALSVEELRFLYQIKKRIATFGNYQNPKIDKLIRERDVKEDLSVIYDTQSDTEIVDSLLKDGRRQIFLDNLDKFSGVSETVAQSLVEDGHVKSVLKNLKSFERVDLVGIQDFLTQKRMWQTILNNIEAFPMVFADQEVLDLLMRDDPILLLRNLEVLKGVQDIDAEALSNEILERAFDSGDLVPIIENLSYFDESKYSSIAEAATHDGRSCLQLARKLSRFHKLDSAVAERLIESSYGVSVAESLGSFKNISGEVAVALVEMGNGFGNKVARYISAVDPAQHNEVLVALIETNQLGSLDYQTNVMSFKNIKKDSLERLIETGYPKIASEFIKERCVEAGTLGVAVAEGLIDAGLANDVAWRIEYFSTSEHKEIAARLLEGGNEEALLSNLDSFSNVDEQALAETLLAEGKEEVLASYLRNFKQLNEAVAARLVEAGFGLQVGVNMRHFALAGQSLAEVFIAHGDYDGLARGIGNFENLNTEVALKLMEEGQIIGYPNLKPFENADLKQIADALVRNGKEYSIRENLSTFKEKLTTHELTQVLIDAGSVNSLVELDGLDSEENVEYFIQSDSEQRLLLAFEEFVSGDFDDLMNQDEEKFQEALADSLDDLDTLAEHLLRTEKFLQLVIKKLEDSGLGSDSMQRYGVIHEKFQKIRKRLEGVGVSAAA